VILVGEYKFFLHVFACFCYWEMCTGSDKNRKPDAMVRTRCYELGRYFYNFISKMDPPLPKEWYYDMEWTKDYIYKNVTIYAGAPLCQPEPSTYPTVAPSI